MSYAVKNYPSYGQKNQQFQHPVAYNKVQINFSIEKPNFVMNPEIHHKGNNKPSIVIPQSIFPSIPIAKNPPSFNNEEKREDKKINESRDELKNMNEDLVKLKSRFQNLITDYPAVSGMNAYAHNSKSSDNLFSPYSRIPSIHSPQDQDAFAKKGRKEINVSLQNQNKQINVQNKKQIYEQKPHLNKMNISKQNQYSQQNNLKIKFKNEQFQFGSGHKTIQVEKKYTDRSYYDQNSIMNSASASKYSSKNIYNQKQLDLNINKSLGLTATNDYNNLRQNKSFSSLNNYETDREYKKIINDINTQLLIEKERQKVELQKKLDLAKAENVNLQHENESLKYKIECLNMKLQQITQCNAKIAQEHQQTKNRQNLLSEKALKLQKQLLKIKNKNRNNYDDVLKTQMQETKQIVKRIQQKNDEITRLNETIFMNRRKTEEAINSAEIQRLKYIAEKKQIEKLSQIQILNRENEIKTLKNALETMHAKLKVAIKDNKTKDEFFQQYLTGRAKSVQQKDHITNILAKYETQYPKDNLIEKLLEEQKQIQRLKLLIENNSNIKS